MKHVYIWTGTRPSDSAQLLAKTMGCKKIKCKNSKYRPRPNHTIINWGCSKLPPFVNLPRIINQPNAVENAIHKLNCFKVLKAHDVSIPEYTTDRNVVRAKLNDSPWLARHTLTGSGGAGITIINNVLELNDCAPAPLYVKYIPKKYEVRIHVAAFEGKEVSAFDWQQKMNRLGEAQQNWKIRSHGNGFIFARHETTVPHGVLRECEIEACRAVSALGLDFGAVDTIYNERHGKAYVLEINSAPGIENTTAENYAKMFKEMLGG